MAADPGREADPDPAQPADLQALCQALARGQRRFHDLRLADLDGVDLDLSDCDLRQADLRGCDLRDCNLDGARLEQAALQGARRGSCLGSQA